MSSPSLIPWSGTPDPFEGFNVIPDEAEVWVNSNMSYSQVLDIWTSPAPDARGDPGDLIDPIDDLGPPLARPQRDKRVAVREDTRFIRLERAVVGQVFELVRIKFARPGYLARVATFLEVRQVGGAQLYISNDLADPDPFPINGISVRWHLRRDDAVMGIDEAPYLTAAPPRYIPSAHAVDGLPSYWDDMRYHWGQREPNKIARLPRATNIRLFAELLGDGSVLTVRLGGQLGGWEGEK